MNYFCRRILLKNTREETGGHIRLESDTGGCAVIAQISGMPVGTRLLLLRRDGGTRDAGALSGGRLSILLRGEDAASFVSAVITCEGRALLFGGDRMDAEQARKAAAQIEYPRETAVHITAQEALVLTGEGAANAFSAAHSAEEPEIIPSSLEAAQCLPLQDATQCENGWVIRETADGERFDATLFENGAPALSLDGMRAAQSPLPPPGISHAQWIEGFFVEARESGE